MKHRLAFASLMLLCGCSGSIDPYPKHWAPIKEEGWFACPKLTGTFEYAGKRADGNWSYALSSLLLGYPRHEGATHVTLDASDQGTRLSVWNGGSQITRGWVGVEHSCSKGTMHTKTMTEPRSNAEISMALDGSIVALLHNETWWFLAIVPLRHQSGAWFRWREYQPARTRTHPPEKIAPASLSTKTPRSLRSLPPSQGGKT